MTRFCHLSGNETVLKRKTLLTCLSVFISFFSKGSSDEICSLRGKMYLNSGKRKNTFISFSTFPSFFSKELIVRKVIMSEKS